MIRSRPAPNPTAAALCAGLRARERWAHTALFVLFEGRVRSVIRRRAPHLNPSEVADEVHDVFVGLMSRNVHVRSSIEGYLVRVAVNHCASRARHWRAVQRATDVLEREAAVVDRPSAGPPSVTSSDLAVIRTYLETYPEEREVYELMYVEGVGRPEIVKRTNWSERHARERMQRLHDRLSEFLDERRKVGKGKRLQGATP